jgi:hypothetical protein
MITEFEQILQILRGEANLIDKPLRHSFMLWFIIKVMTGHCPVPISGQSFFWELRRGDHQFILFVQDHTQKGAVQKPLASIARFPPQMKAMNRPAEHLFLNPPKEKPISEIKTSFNSATRRAGIQGLRFHDLRHTFVSRLIERGVDIVTVQSLLGHHSIVVTQRYTHSSAAHKRNQCPHKRGVPLHHLYLQLIRQMIPLTLN